MLLFFRLNDALTQCDVVEDGLAKSLDPQSDRRRASREMYSGTSQEKPQTSHMQQVDKNLGMVFLPKAVLTLTI